MSMDDMLYDAARDAATEECDSLRNELQGEFRSDLQDTERRVNDLDEIVERIDNALCEHLGHYADDFINIQASRITQLERRLTEALRGSDERIEQLRALNEAVFDTASSASRQCFIDTGRYLTHYEVAEQEAMEEEADGFVERESYEPWSPPIQHEQRKAIFGLLHRLGWTGPKQDRLNAVNAVLEHEGMDGVGSFVNLSEWQASAVIVAFETAAIVKEALS